MADLSITIDTKGLDDAKKKLSEFQNQMGKSSSILALSNGLSQVERNIAELIKAQDKGRITAKSFDQAIEGQRKALQTLGISYGEAKDQVENLVASLKRQEAARKAAEAARELARSQEEAALASQRLAQRHQELRMRFVDGYAANQRYRQSVNDLKEAYRAGIIPTLEVYKQKLRELRAANQQAIGNIRGNNGVGVAIQQLGYQVGDFAVQVQSGTSVFVAFGQQATQLAGIIPLVHTQLGLTAMQAIGLSTGLGIIIPIATAVGRYLWELSGDSKTLEERFSDLSQASDRLGGLFDILDSTDLEETYGSLTPKVRELTQSFVELNSAGELKALAATLDKLKKDSEADWFQRILSAGQVLVSTNTAYALRSLIDPTFIAGENQKEFEKYGFGIGRDVYLNIVEGMKAEAKSGDREGVLTVFQDLMNQINQGTVTLEGIDLLNELREALLRAAENAAKLNGSAKAAAEANKAAEEAAKAQEKALKAAAEEAEKIAEASKKVNDYHEELGYKLDEQTAKYLEAQGLEQQALALRKQVAYERARDEVLAQAATAQQAIDLAASADLAGQAAAEAVQMAHETDKARAAAKGFADNLRDAASAMSSLTSLGSTIERALVVSQAKVDALKNKADATVATTIAGYRFDIRKKTDEAIAAAVTAGQSPTAAIQEGARQMATVNELQKSLTEGAKLSDSKKGGGAAPGRIDTQEEYIQKLIREFDLKKKTLSMSDEQVKRAEFIFKMDEKIATMKTKMSEDQIAALKAEALAAYDVYTALEKWQDIIDRVESTIEDAFMSMIDGSKSVSDAFKGMLREILLDIYRQQVAKPFASGFGNFLAGLGGGGGTGSFGLPMPFASGGVVNRATMFPMASGRTGVMGEAGPEAIMPLKRGKDGKLGVTVSGSSNEIHVTNNINVMGNSDPAAVRAEIAKLMPQITNATKSAVIDARRRGGQMKATFG